jgi:hypothetical protein
MARIPNLYQLSAISDQPEKVKIGVSRGGNYVFLLLAYRYDGL